MFRAIHRADNIAPDVRRQIAATWIASKGATLDALARLDPPRQREVVALLLKEGGPKNVAAALVELGGPMPEQTDSTEGEYSALLKAWRRAGAKARDRFTSFLASEGAIPNFEAAA